MFLLFNNVHEKFILISIFYVVIYITVWLTYANCIELDNFREISNKYNLLIQAILLLC